MEVGPAQFCNIFHLCCIVRLLLVERTHMVYMVKQPLYCSAACCAPQSSTLLLASSLSVAVHSDEQLFGLSITESWL